ncbi:uncharacterized protein LOC125941839 [Dermacentor silvarum]|uniref:uncharacterized protein LOC125941839 n=1 Tax=Dermacentor silvarum TaxID=543639 RepID=UPI002100F546|nr:uncharacterized protein LOC125941839 [Dermacentor silvarum]
MLAPPPPRPRRAPSSGLPTGLVRLRRPPAKGRARRTQRQPPATLHGSLTPHTLGRTRQRRDFGHAHNYTKEHKAPWAVSGRKPDRGGCRRAVVLTERLEASKRSASPATDDHAGPVVLRRADEAHVVAAGSRDGVLGSSPKIAAAIIARTVLL